VSADREIVVESDSQALAGAVAETFVQVGQSAISARGDYRVALSGGNTPRALFTELAGKDDRNRIDWTRCEIFFSDERFVPHDSAESNYHTAREALLSKVPVPAHRVHPVPTAWLEPERSALEYEQEIRRVFGAKEGETPRFDLILLGLGPDGHTASLFPGTTALTVRDRLVAPNFVPTLNAWRITFTYTLINEAQNVAFLVAGDDKAERVAEVLEGTQDLPAGHVKPVDGRLLWMLDAAAAAVYMEHAKTSEIT
jgi:6-phosphogluconolactonase